MEVENQPERMREVAGAIAALPAEVLEHRSSPRAFGSWYLVFRFQGRPFRVVFDGKDPACVLERSTTGRPPYRWEPTGWEVIGPAARSFPVEDLVAAVRREAAGGR